jgi:cytochrome c553
MRITLMLLALAGLSACDRNASTSDNQAAPVMPAALTFEGATTTDLATLIAHGERISWALGCRGCHGPDLQGHYFYERYASNLTRDLHNYSDAEIERVIRSGVPPDGRELWGMPSEIFQHLSDADMKALIADFRTLKPDGTPTQPPKPWAPDAVEMIAKGEFKTAKDTVLQNKANGPIDLGPKYALGRYITRVTCAECHGPKLEGGPPGAPPDLKVAGGYTRAEFEALLTKGIAPGGRQLKSPLMGEVARKRFVHFTPNERDAVFAYLKARAEQPQ